jgi:hypothetical protein
MASIIEHVRGNIPADKYYADEFEDLQWPASNSEGRVMCPFHDDKNTPSLSLNPENGKWYCHGCARGGKSIVSFHAERYELSQVDAARALFHKYIHPVIPEKKVRRWRRQLEETPSALKYLVEERFISTIVIRRRKLGWDGEHIVLPIYNEFNLCVNAKLLDPLVSKRIKKGRFAVKMLNYQDESDGRSFGSPPMFYPIENLIEVKDDEWAFLCSGDLDALVLESLGLKSFTTTAGEKSWPAQYNYLFYKKKVAVVYDCDTQGKDAVRKRVVPNLTNKARIIKRVEIPKEVGKDVTNWVEATKRMRRGKAWIRAAKKAKTLVNNPIEAIRESDVSVVPLDQATQAKWFGQKIAVNALVTGKDLAPYILPKTVRVDCNRSCDTCPLADRDGPKEYHVDSADPKVLKMVDIQDNTMQKMLYGLCNMKPSGECESKVEVVDTFNLERLLLTPTIEAKAGAQYVMTPAFYAGHGLRSNRAYQFTGITTVDPQDQHATHLFSEAKPAQDQIDNFELTATLKRQLTNFSNQNADPYQAFVGLAEWQSRDITKIKDRPDLHNAVDLGFHSVRSFEFNNEFVRRGMLDILIIGDTRCGKGFVAEGLVRYFGLGEVASAENCSYAGLVGGIEQPTGRRNMVKWGVIPLNNDRLIVIDEASALKYEDISRMSRIRSEGIAEVHKIQREVTQANTRLIWLSNTRDGQPIMEQGMGVKAIKQLIGANEDISRFDFAMTVATNEVPSEVINDTDQKTEHSEGPLTADQARAVILWAWSRRMEQIIFTERSTRTIIQEAVHFGRDYSSKIPLVQGENIRIKLAKISAAVAARLFSTDETCEKLIIKECHVQFACNFLRTIYDKPSMSYSLFSQTALAANILGSVDPIFNRLGTERQAIINGLHDIQKVTTDSLSDYYGEPSATRIFISDLVKERCLVRIEGANWYLKTSAFNSWLKQHRKEPHVSSNGQAHHSNGR